MSNYEKIHRVAMEMQECVADICAVGEFIKLIETTEGDFHLENIENISRIMMLHFYDCEEKLDESIDKIFSLTGVIPGVVPEKAVKADE